MYFPAVTSLSDFEGFFSEGFYQKQCPLFMDLWSPEHPQKVQHPFDYIARRSVCTVYLKLKVAPSGQIKDCMCRAGARPPKREKSSADKSLLTFG